MVSIRNSKKIAKKMGVTLDYHNEVLEEKTPPPRKKGESTYLSIISKGTSDKKNQRGETFYISWGKFNHRDNDNVFYGVTKLSESFQKRAENWIKDSIRELSGEIESSSNGNLKDSLDKLSRFMNSADYVNAVKVSQIKSLDISLMDEETTIRFDKSLGNTFEKYDGDNFLWTKKFSVKSLDYISAIKEVSNLGISGLDKAIFGESYLNRISKKSNGARSNGESKEEKNIRIGNIRFGVPILMKHSGGEIVFGNYSSGIIEGSKFTCLQLKDCISVSRGRNPNGNVSVVYKGLEFQTGGVDETSFHTIPSFTPRGTEKYNILAIGKEEVMKTLYEIQSRSSLGKNVLPLIEALGGDAQYFLKEKIDLEEFYRINPSINRTKVKLNSPQHILFKIQKGMINLEEHTKVYSSDGWPEKFELPGQDISIAEYRKLKAAYEERAKREGEPYSQPNKSVNSFGTKINVVTNKKYGFNLKVI